MRRQAHHPAVHGRRRVTGLPGHDPEQIVGPGRAEVCHEVMVGRLRLQEDRYLLDRTARQHDGQELGQPGGPVGLQVLPEQRHLPLHATVAVIGHLPLSGQLAHRRGDDQDEICPPNLVDRPDGPLLPPVVIPSVQVHVKAAVHSQELAECAYQLFMPPVIVRI